MPGRVGSRGEKKSLLPGAGRVFKESSALGVEWADGVCRNPGAPVQPVVSACVREAVVGNKPRLLPMGDNRVGQSMFTPKRPARRT